MKTRVCLKYFVSDCHYFGGRILEQNGLGTSLGMTGVRGGEGVTDFQLVSTLCGLLQSSTRREAWQNTETKLRPNSKLRL